MDKNKNFTHKKALLSDCSIIILDEATNQLDNITSNYIKNSIDRLKKTKTLIIISHDKTIDKIVDVSVKIKKKISR